MKIIRKLTPVLFANLLVISPILSTTSCSCYFELNLNQQQQYIYDRTFSLMCKNNNSYVFGTGWIISDATDTNPNDYKYWLATNWHVTHGFNNLKGKEFYYADQSLCGIFSNYVNYNNYKKFNKFEIEEETKFVYDTTNIKWTAAIDLAVVMVDFGKPTGNILKKLDKINDYKKQNGYINKFAKYNSAINSKNKIIGGYPMKGSKSSFGGQWETHSFSGSILEYYGKNSKFDGQNQGHAIGNPLKNQDGTNRIEGQEDFNYWDVSPQYKFIESVNEDYMSGGASGSMMITDDYEVCGIYWGGWGIDNSNKFLPSFSIFNTVEKNFLEEYI